jgi:O-methyltransferase
VQAKLLLQSALNSFGLGLRRTRPPAAFASIPDRSLYQPLYSPWLAPSFRRYFDVAAPRTLVTPDRCYVLYTLLQQAAHLEGDVWECGTYKGGTAAMMAAILRDQGSVKQLHLFDTFEGMPATDATRDLHRLGDFADTSVEAVAGYVGRPAVLHKGLVPDTFAGLETARIAFAHIDLDIYQSIIDSLTFIWPRLSRGGFIVLDDYGFPSCPGARAAVDEFFARRSSVPLCLHTGQALLFKGAEPR